MHVPLASFITSRRHWVGGLVGFVMGTALLIGMATDVPLFSSAHQATHLEEDEPHLVFLIGEREYNTKKTLSAFAREELQPRGFRTTFVYADSQASGNDFPGLDVLQEADLLVLSVRRRTPPDEQMALIQQYIGSGKPVLALRTASHAFALRKGNPPEGHAQWQGLDEEVLGAPYEGHHSEEGAQVAMTLDSGNHPILRGLVSTKFHSGGTLYRYGAMNSTTEVLLRGRQVQDQDQRKPIEWTNTEPVAWTNTDDDGGRVFYTSLGHPKDFEQRPFRRMLTNAVYWSLGQEVPRDMTIAGNAEVEEYLRSRPGRGEIGGESQPVPPREALKAFEVAENLDIELVASEPTITQPLKLSFDPRGRLWVMQYNQYPYPEGVQIVDYDRHMRAKFDTVPAPPPKGAQGVDRVTVLSDTNGDGTYDSAEDVITGLNIATSIVVGRGGVWVLSPPYLLFYPDPDSDGKPDGPPEVRLRGFGLTDTHAAANGLIWGPDGWLYGAQGSTAESTVSSAVTKEVHFQGQAVWRYHPETKVFELFAEGGGNTWNPAFDRKGRLFSGTNAGVRGLHYKQGAYYEKSWGKHGPLTNPYAFGFFGHMKHTGNSDRFTHTIQIYEGEGLPDRYEGRLIGVNALQGRVQTVELKPRGSTFETIEKNRILETEDQWSRPLDIETGPGGAVYISDWYDDRLTHVDPSDNWHRASGRIYRISGPDTQSVEPFDLTQRTTDELIDLLSHPNRWYRRTAVRLIGDREDQSVVPRLKRMVEENTGQLALEALWALNLSGGFDKAFMPVALRHPDPHVRRWTVRLIGDARQVPDEVAPLLAELARTESNVEVRSQLASSAKRLPGEAALPIIRALLSRDEDVDDPHIPLQLWWALEAHVESERTEVLELFENPSFWKQPLVDQVITKRLTKRYVRGGGKQNLNAAARLLTLAPGEHHTQLLMNGLQEGLRGRELTDMPLALEKALEAYRQRIGQSDVALGLRQRRSEAPKRALTIIEDPKADNARRLEYLKILREVPQPEAVPTLLKVLRKSSSDAVRIEILKTLRRYDNPDISEQVIELYPGDLRAHPEMRAQAIDLLVSRKSWTKDLLKTIEGVRALIEPEDIPRQAVEQMALHNDPEIVRSIEKYWPEVRSRTPAQVQQKIEETAQVLRSGSGDAEAGRSVFMSACGRCHALYGEGGAIGPELTGYDRDNLENLLLNTIDPNASIRAGYVSYVVRTKDGRVLTGIVEDRSGGTITLRSLSGQTTTISDGQIEEMKEMQNSIMPGGLLEPLTDQEVQDLFAYLQSDSPPESSSEDAN